MEILLFKSVEFISE